MESRKNVGDEVFEKTVSALGQRVSRRNLLVRAAVAGSALAVAPIRYLTEPISASTLVTCSNCSSSAACSGGYSTFCCTLTGSNSCPSYTELGGWWKCTNYTGTKMCDAQNVRWYVDCNRKSGQNCPTGTVRPYGVTGSCPSQCHCANDNCSQRKTCCNNFKYGQCNVNSPVTQVVCRVVKCTRPCDVWPNQCNCSPYAEDNNTCSHEAGCL
jgi:hypothetical protein